MKKKIFVVGTGRSGTHWLGHILESSPEIRVQIERWPIFGWVTQAAIDYKKRKKILPFIIIYYRLITLFSKRHVADKSHPNIWLIESIVKYIPNSYFIGIIRNPYATVSSMLLHKGVLKWIQEWEKYPIPNEFLGITTKNAEQYKNLPLEAKCTLRWIAHKCRLMEIQNKYPDKFLMIEYEAIFDNSKHQISEIQNFIGLANKLPLPDIKQESKNKWKQNLNTEQIEIINKTLISNGLSNYINNL